MSLNTTPRTFVTGEIETAAIFNAEVRDALTGVQAAWTAWTPTITNMTLGNGSVIARARQIGKTVSLRFALTAGSTTTYTATGVTVSLPFAAHASGEQGMSAKIFTGSNFDGAAVISPGASVFTPFVPTTTTATTIAGMSSATVNPGTVGNLEVFGSYEAA